MQDPHSRRDRALDVSDSLSVRASRKFSGRPERLVPVSMYGRNLARCGGGATVSLPKIARRRLYRVCSHEPQWRAILPAVRPDARRPRAAREEDSPCCSIPSAILGFARGADGFMLDRPQPLCACFPFLLTNLFAIAAFFTSAVVVKSWSTGALSRRVRFSGTSRGQVPNAFVARQHHGVTSA